MGKGVFICLIVVLIKLMSVWVKKKKKYELKNRMLVGLDSVVIVLLLLNSFYLVGKERCFYGLF